MSEEIDLDANNLNISEEVFDKFQSGSVYEEDDYITLSDIVPPQPTAPDISQELNEIPYDNEVVLGSPQQNDESGQVNSKKDTGPQLLDISENNVFNQLETSGEGYQNNDIPTDVEVSTGNEPKRQKRQSLQGSQDLSSDGLGAQNYVIEDSSSIIQDSLLSTTVGQNDVHYETPSELSVASGFPRRTKRGRIPNTAKYPMTLASDSDSNITTPAKRRPGRPPRKVSLIQTTLEPDSTNVDTSLFPLNESTTDGSGLDELPPNNVKKGRRGRAKASLELNPTPTPSKRGRKPRVTPPNEHEAQNNSHLNENALVESTNPEVEGNQIELNSSIPNNDVSKLTLSTSKRKKRGPKKGKKEILESTPHENIGPLDNDNDLNDDADDICLSKLKQDLKEVEANSEVNVSIDNVSNATEVKLTEFIQNDAVDKPSDIQSDTANKPTVDIENDINSEEISSTLSKRNSKMPVMTDFEYNVDKAVKEATTDEQAPVENECLLVEDTSKRRRTAKKTFVYDEGSDEDPFANVESSDEEPKRRKKGTKYYSDDEYVPGSDGRKRGGGKIRSSSSESEDDLEDEDIKKKPAFGVSPFKKGRKPLDNKSLASTIKPLDNKSIISTIAPKAEDDDIEGCIETTMIKVDDSLKPPAEAWATSNEFQNFIQHKIQGTSLKIKKVSSREKTDTLAPLDIPVVDQNEPKKTTEHFTQTKNASVSAVGVQTSAPYDIPMKTNLGLTPKQSEKACEFLSSVVKTTVELGQLMSQKSDDFMKKKINTEHVTDTFKMDYCVRKSFLLFKLAKHNLMQMEEDLANQYDAFLTEHKLSSCREVPKKITPKAKEDSDSDCEIVEVIGTTTGAAVKNEKPKFNPKTVFLNKELSIKIAKKPNTPEKPSPGKNKLEIKGRHAVWINKNVMVKKVPTQSFLAQDSRNKKPPDSHVTEKMVSDFFEDYNRKKALFTCAQFINTSWICIQKEYACHYFVNELDAANTSRNNNELSAIANVNNVETASENCNINEINKFEDPKTLFTLCTEAIRKCLHVKKNQAKETQKFTCNVTDGTDTKGPVALFRLCINAIRTDFLDKPEQYKAQDGNETDENNDLLDLDDRLTEDMIEEVNLSNQYSIKNINAYEEEDKQAHPIREAVLPLTSICYKKIVNIFFGTKLCQVTFSLSEENISFNDSYHNIDSPIHYGNYSDMCRNDEEYMYLSDKEDTYLSQNERPLNNGSKSLLTLCVELIQSMQGFSKKSTAHSSTTWCPNIGKIKPLKSIAFESVRHNLYHGNDEEIFESAADIESYNDIEETNENFTINCVNTLSEEAFKNLQVPVRIRIRKQSQDSTNYSDGFENDNLGDHDEVDFNADHEDEDNGWASQLQMQELRSCFTPHVTTENTEDENNESLYEPQEITRQIKSEPLDDLPEENIVDTSIVKTEPLQGLQSINEMTHIPDNIITKKELIEATNDRGGSPLIQSTSGYNVETFEQFVISNKMMQSLDESHDHEIFSQSGLRIRRQHEPDLDPGHDSSMSLLVPHTFEPLHLVEAKGRLMETSSDDDSGNSKKTGKKKDKRKKKNKRDVKNNTKETPVVSKETNVVKEKIMPENEVAVLTRRMREKIRQEEKKIESSESDSESFYLLTSKKDKINKDKSQQDKEKVESGSDSDTLYMLTSISDTDKPKNSKKEIEKVKQPKLKLSKENKQKDDQVQCNNVDSTEKFVNDSNKTEVQEKDEFSGFTAIDQNETTNYQKLMQFVYDKIVPKDHDNDKNTTEEANETSPIIHPDEPVELLECEPIMPIFDDEPRKPGPKKYKKQKNLEIEEKEPQFTERHGWHCYNIDPSDNKLYKDAQIVLEKLPESFVETYMEYQDVMDKDMTDEEVDRLINLHSLNRSISVKDIKDGKSKSRPKGTGKDASTSGQNSGNISRSPSPAYSDNFEELAPSDDEGPKAEDEIPPPMPERSSENHLAKNLLMADHDSDSDGAGENKIKVEPKTTDEEVIKPRKAGPKSKTKSDKVDPDSLMLTADKMMNKELNLLHAPILLPEDVKSIEVKETSPKEDTKNNKKISTKQTRERVKNDDDSSSEEEKQWVSTKEKLLKRMGKKEDAVADDAKRVKLVNEFIVRRSESDRKNKRESGLNRKGRARRKMLERQKQLRFLTNELFNESIDGVTTGKRGAAAGLFKGRRNIRKVIDKKSLARSTVVANMEEFERKRRLNIRQNKLREVLGCEEGVSVLVINDEVCLEYDFEEQRPVVTVHQFFTKVMKAHQYEGVKFMWDACFESLGTIEAGHPGGGCILAHCMGLGKTLQVLALLHTVLTHPRANMHRVLVCCPLSTVLNWVDEIHKWIGPVTHQIKVFELSKLRKTYERAYQLEDWYNGGGIFIIGYELFRSLTTLDPEIDEIRPTIINKIRNALLDPGPDIIICDEGHLLKNDCSVLAVAMSRVVTKRRIVLTGTPMQNNLREYFCMVNFIKPNLLGTYSEYSNRFENPIMNGQHRDSREEDIKLMKARTHILHKVLEGCLQRQEASVLYPYLPKKHEYTVFIPLTQCQWDLYNHYIEKYAKTQKQKQILKDFHILQKIWSHPQVLHNFQMKARDKKDKIKAEKIEDDLAIADQEADIKPAETEVWWLEYLEGGSMLDSLDSSNKFVAVFRILHECVALGDKVLIFSTSLFCLDALEYFLKTINKWSLGQEYYRLDGSVPAEVRQKWVREFNAENNIKTKLFLISTRAGCLGLNMTAANRVIILDTSWNPAHDIQSIFRVYRFGQKKDCYIYRLVALGTMEQKIYERSVTKQAVACRVVDEQQIDRHYNLAELTELYSVDEMGLSVAGGVAVGVGDVALLRVARDAAIHAIHEHDSLLRGSGEQGLPEHERAAAWNQFQQEHEHKQMQNDLNANRAVVALKRLEMEHLRQQALYSAQNEAPPGPVKMEPPNNEYPLLEPKVEPSGSKQRGRKPKNSDNLVQCRIPIASGPQPGPSHLNESNDQQDMVKKITTLLIKHNFMQNKGGPKQISELVAKVKRMVATGKPMTLGPGYDELSSSIANVLLHRENPMPALTNIEPIVEPIIEQPIIEQPIIEQPIVEAAVVEPPKRISVKKLPIEPKPSPSMPVLTIDGRVRRKAALAAEVRFDSLLDVIDLDDDGDEWQNDDIDDIDEIPIVEPEPDPIPVKKPEKVPGKKGKKTKPADPSILLSDDEAPPEVIAPAPTPNTSSSNEDNDVVALHPSLLTNANFIKIVAHTYLAGNPMMDEDAATLAAQYSTLKTLKEAESEGKQIESGAVYDIAVQVLGKDVLRKLQAANPKTSGDSSLAAKKLQSLVGDNSTETETPVSTPPSAPPVKKAKIGPKSKVMKEVKQEPQTEATTKPVTKLSVTPKVVGISKTSILPPNVLREESILPDDEEVIISEPTLEPAPVDRKSILLRKVKLERVIKLPPATVRPVAMGRGPAPQATPPAEPMDATICLDSDEEDAAPAVAPPPVRRQRTIQMPTLIPASQPAPVPVALTGPNVRPIALPPPAQPVHQPIYYTLSPCGKHAIPVNSKPVPISMTGPKGAPQPVPISLLGPGKVPISLIPDQPAPVSMTGPNGTQVFSVAGRQQPVPVAFTGPNGSQTIYSGQDRSPVPISLTGPGSQPVPVSLIGPGSQPMPMSLSGPGIKPGTMVYAASQPVPMSLVDSSGRPVTISASSMRSHKGPLTLRMQQAPQIPTAGTPTTPLGHAARLLRPIQKNTTPNVSNPSQTVNTGNLNRPSKTGVVDILNRKLGRPSSTDVVTHTIVDDEPQPVPIAPNPVPIASQPAEVVPKKPSEDKSNPLQTPLTEVKAVSRRQTSRRVSSSSSSSSGRSRSSSPDPLAILKDVVHIQAPAKQSESDPIKKAPNTPITTKASNPTTTKPKPKSTPNRKSNTKSTGKVSDLVDLTDVSSVKSKIGTKKASGTVDLTSLPNQGAKPNTRNATKDSVHTKLNTSTKTTPSKLVGTSKSIILDGKSKSLKVENKNTASTTQSSSSKAMPGSSTNKIKQEYKRPAPSTPSAPALKKKKTELMTLKDFDIDDIDDIIELD